MYGQAALVPFQQEKVGNLDCDHRCKDRADQIEEICDVVHRIYNRCDGSNDVDNDGHMLSIPFAYDGLAGNSCGVGIQKCRCYC